MSRFWLISAALLLLIGVSSTIQLSSSYKESLVSVREVGESPSLEGSGFIYSSEGYIVTNNHIVMEKNGGLKDLEIRFNRTDEWKEAVLVGRDPVNDVAVLYVDINSGVEGLSIYNSTIENGQKVSVLGNPLGREGVRLPGKIIEVNQTIVTQEGTTVRDSIVISTDVKPGSSGGPVINSEGQVLGMVSARGTEEDVGFAVPGSILNEAVNRLIQNQNMSEASNK